MEDVNYQAYGCPFLAQDEQSFQFVRSLANRFHLNLFAVPRFPEEKFSGCLGLPFWSLEHGFSPSREERDAKLSAVILLFHERAENLCQQSEGRISFAERDEIQPDSRPIFYPPRIMDVKMNHQPADFDLDRPVTQRIQIYGTNVLLTESVAVDITLGEIADNLGLERFELTEPFDHVGVDQDLCFGKEITPDLTPNERENLVREVERGYETLQSRIGERRLTAFPLPPRYYWIRAPEEESDREE